MPCLATLLPIPRAELMTTALVWLENVGKEKVRARALLDSGASTNFISIGLARSLRLPMRRCFLPIGAVNSMTTISRRTVDITFGSYTSAFKKTLTFHTVPKISDAVPSDTFPRNLIDVPRNIKLADSQFHLPAPIDLLIGSGTTLSLLSIGQIKISNHDVDICIQKTCLGWIVAGGMRIGDIQKTALCNFTDLNSALHQFWNLEEVKSDSKKSPSEILCEKHFVENVTRDSTGRYVVRLPFKPDAKPLGDSYQSALKRLNSLLIKLDQNTDLRDAYTKILQEYMDLGHMTELKGTVSGGYYLPHHAVFKHSSTTTKVRVVYDASHKSSNGLSLNDSLLVGPVIQDQIFEHLVRFRFPRYVITADLEKMYRQILMHDDDRVFQRILWRVDDVIKTFQLNTVTFGVSSSSFLAIRTIHQLADDECHNFPRAAKILKRDLYVDDLLTSADSISDAREIRKEVTELLIRGGFNIRQWASNNPRILDGVSEGDLNAKLSLSNEGELKTLGVSWNAKDDTICYTVNPISIGTKVTKRTVLSDIAKIFDPLGLLGPVILYAKSIMQLLWKRKLDWNESLPQDLYSIWYDFVTQLNLLNGLKFSRMVLLNDYIRFELHGFCDASETGYGACIYIRSEGNEGQCLVRLLTAKSKVAPVKPPTTIPRAELLAAVILARLYKKVMSTINYNIESFFWSDSTIVLQWIQKPPHTLQTFVSNRVSVIQEMTDIKQWRHIAGTENPSDVLSRGQLPGAFLKNKTWCEGPDWLSDPKDTWPESIIQSKDNLPELKRACCFAINTLDQNFLTRFPFSKLLRILSYYTRFFHYLRRKQEIHQNGKVKNEILKQRLNEELDKEPLDWGPLTVTEINHTETQLIKNIQNTYFHKEIYHLKNNKSLIKGKLPFLDPFVDKEGVLRVGGRLKRADIEYSKRHPILLPSKNIITDNIIREIHETNFHTGIQTTLYLFRQKFWICDGRNQVRKVIRNCMKCFRFNANPINYKMGDLPASRVQASRPFLHVGTDFCGPFYIKEKKLRNRAKIKIYVCIFICMSIKAVHLEVVSDLTSDAFIAAFRRFISRRGFPAHIYSDNGLNYVGANNNLKELYTFLESETHKNKLNQFALKHRITWHFNPPLAPHFGGLWESTVRIFKHHLKRVVGDTLLTYEHFESLTTEIEGVLNSRPIIPMSSDPNDLLALTPAHYLIGEPLKNLPENNYLDVPENRLSCWQHLIKMRQDFWSRWRLEYLNELQTRQKWVKDGIQLKEGMMVLIKEKTASCFQWPLGRVIKLHPGEDGITRTATVKTAESVLKRPAKLLCPLPFEI